MNQTPLKHCPVAPSASGSEPEYKNTAYNESKVCPNELKQFDLFPNHGKEETIVTVVVQGFPAHTPAKLAFNNIVVDTNKMQQRDTASLLASVPPFKQLGSLTSTVPVSIYFFNDEKVAFVWFVANFKYDRSDEELSLTMMGNRFHTRDHSTTVAYQNPHPIVYSAPQIPSYQHFFYQQQRYALDDYVPCSGSSDTADLNKTDNSSGNPADYLPQPTTPYSTTSQNRMKAPRKRKAPYIPTVPVAEYHPYPNITSQPSLSIMGDLDSMRNNWTRDEKEQGRRLVQFIREQNEQNIRCHFQSILSQEEVPKEMVVVSCLYWAEQKQFFITSVDCIYLLEALINVKFGVNEKNRIRRNLEGFGPLTVSKSKKESFDFFKQIMGFSKPKPRNIEKDVKVFPWKTLPYALKKIITKYNFHEFRSGREV